MISIKPGVSLRMTPENDIITHAVDEALHSVGQHAYITSGNDGAHRHDSKHYSNAALDFRIVWAAFQERSFLQKLRESLPPSYRYLLESDHLHVERATVPDNLKVT